MKSLVSKHSIQPSSNFFPMALQTEILSTEISEFLKPINKLKSCNSAVYVAFATFSYLHLQTMHICINKYSKTIGTKTACSVQNSEFIQSAIVSLTQG